MKKVQLRNKEIKELDEQIHSLFGINNFFNKKDRIELVEDSEKLILNNSEAAFFFKNDIICPTIKTLLKNCFLKKVTVDMGAVKFVVSGADIMRPGITEIEDGIKKDDFIAVVDEKNQKVLSVGKALFSGEEILAMQGGKVIKNLHFIGDKIFLS